MKLDAAPAPVVAKLLRLEQDATQLNDRVQHAAASIASSQARLRNGGHGLKTQEHDDLLVAVREAVAAQPRLEGRSYAAAAIVRECKRWLESLPEGTQLARKEVDTDGRSLSEVRARIASCEAELKVLRAAPTPSADIEKRLRAYVASLGRPKLSGIQASEQLRVDWPDSGPTLAAFLAPDVVIAALMQEVERMANTPMPPTQRKQRIAVLVDEIRELFYVEEALVIADAGERSKSAPAWAILGAAIVAADKERAA